MPENGDRGPNPYQAAAEREERGKASLRRPSVVESPDLKKPKLEGSLDCAMREGEGAITPGEPIFGTQEESLQSEDVDIPIVAPSQAANIPASRAPQMVDLTEQDKRLDDELAGAAAPNRPDMGAGLLRLLSSDQSGSNPAAFNQALRAEASTCNLISNSSNSPNLPPGAASTSTANHLQPNPYPQEMPPWLADLHAGLQSLHQKADRQYNDITNGLQVQGVRLSHLEATTAEHTDRHTKTDLRLNNIEQKLREIDQIREELSRSPRQGPAPRSPRSPRSPRQPHFGYRDDISEEDLDFDLVAGGWIDARRDDAIQEVRNILQDTQLTDKVEEVWALYSRTSFVRIRLAIDVNLPISAKHKIQKGVLDKLKLKKYVSGVPGREQVKLWVTRSKTPEERVRTRAIVLCKTFYCKLPHKDPNQPPPFSELNVDIAWNGKVFFGKHQLLGNIQRDGEPKAYDLLLSDSRGNHLEWYIIAKAFAAVTGRQQEDLQDTWDRFGPSADRPE